ncbi:hypothetical protein DV736_g2830, partial [Chaetothyriales sp. CBS 134916]
MSSSTAIADEPKTLGLRKNGKSPLHQVHAFHQRLTDQTGKNWHQAKKAFRPTAGLTVYEKRKRLDQEKQATKAREQEIKEEAKQERDRKIQAIKDRRKAKEEKERYEKMAEKMHHKLVERRKQHSTSMEPAASGGHGTAPRGLTKPIGDAALKADRKLDSETAQLSIHEIGMITNATGFLYSSNRLGHQLQSLNQVMEEKEDHNYPQLLGITSIKLRWLWQMC